MQNFLDISLTAPKNYDEAESVFVQTLSLQRKVLGDDHFDTKLTIRNSAEPSQESGESNWESPSERDSERKSCQRYTGLQKNFEDNVHSNTKA